MICLGCAVNPEITERANACAFVWQVHDYKFGDNSTGASQTSSGGSVTGVHLVSLGIRIAGHVTAMRLELRRTCVTPPQDNVYARYCTFLSVCLSAMTPLHVDPQSNVHSCSRQ